MHWDGQVFAVGTVHYGHMYYTYRSAHHIYYNMKLTIAMVYTCTSLAYCTVLLPWASILPVFTASLVVP